MITTEGLVILGLVLVGLAATIIPLYYGDKEESRPRLYDKVFIKDGGNMITFRSIMFPEKLVKDRLYLIESKSKVYRCIGTIYDDTGNEAPVLEPL